MFITGLHCIFCGYELPDIEQTNLDTTFDVRKIKCPNCEEEILIESRTHPTTKTKIIIKDMRR